MDDLDHVGEALRFGAFKPILVRNILIFRCC